MQSKNYLINYAKNRKIYDILTNTTSIEDFQLSTLFNNYDETYINRTALILKEDNCIKIIDGYYELDSKAKEIKKKKRRRYSLKPEEVKTIKNKLIDKRKKSMAKSYNLTIKKLN